MRKRKKKISKKMPRVRKESQELIIEMMTKRQSNLKEGVQEDD